MKRNGDSGGEGKGRSLLCGLARLIRDVHPCIGGEASHDGGALRRVELPPRHPVIERVERCHVLSVQLERAGRRETRGWARGVSAGVGEWSVGGRKEDVWWG